MRLSAVIPTLNSAHSLTATIRALGHVDEIIIADGGSEDLTTAVAEALGAKVVSASLGRGTQLIAGAAAATGDWLIFLHADTVLEAEWQAAVAHFAAEPRHRTMAATFRFALDDPSREARRLERWVDWRVRTFGLPYGDQGLLIHRDFYSALGGYRHLPLMEDVDLVRRIGRRRLLVLDATARTSAMRWRRDGWLRRSGRNLLCLSLYFLGVPPRVLKHFYG